VRERGAFGECRIGEHGSAMDLGDLNARQVDGDARTRCDGLGAAPKVCSNDP